MTLGHLKGQKYTNKICRALSHWHDPTLPKGFRLADAPFRARGTIQTPIDGHWDIKGDIVHRPDIAWPFVMECKNREEWRSLDGIWMTPKWAVWDYWAQTVEQADTVPNGAPLLFFSRALRPDYVMLRWTDAERLALQTYAQTPVLWFDHADDDLALCQLEDFVRMPFAEVSAYTPPD